MGSFFKLFVFAAMLSIAAVCVSGQDLGSSNGLFGGGKKTTAPAKTGKKVAAKPKPKATAKAAAKPRKKPAAAKTAKPTQPASKNTASAKPKNADKPTKVEIAPTKPKETAKSKEPEKSKEVDLPVSAANSKLFEKLIDDGNSARDERNYAAAETAYQRAKAIKPRDPRAIYGLGNIYSDQQRWEEAEASYRKALQLDPKDAVTHVALSYVLTQPLSAPDLADRYEEAEKLSRTAIQLAPSNALAFDQLGVALELRGLISGETENAYRRAIQLDPSFAPAYAHLGRLLRRRGLTKESAAAYQNAVDRSTDAATMVLVAEIMQSDQCYTESVKLLRAAIDSDPKNPAALLLLGRALTTQGNFADAEIMLRRGLNISPNGFMPNSLLADLYLRQGKFEQAENSLLQAIRFVPVSEKRLLSRQFESVGDGYAKSGNRKNAERSYQRALSLDPDSLTLGGKLAKTYGG